MNISTTRELAIPGVHIIEFTRFHDLRGFFAEPMRVSDLSAANIGVGNCSFVQMNESVSRAGTVRGLHFQWNPLMGKLVRTISGHMIDLILDIRIGSPTFGKIIAHDMPAVDPTFLCDRWIWVPGGLAHGNYFLEDTRIEYLCTGEYNQACEAGISLFAPDIDWSVCDTQLQRQLKIFLQNPTLTITDKDRNARTVQEWSTHPASEQISFTRVE